LKKRHNGQPRLGALNYTYVIPGKQASGQRPEVKYSVKRVARSSAATSADLLARAREVDLMTTGFSTITTLEDQFKAALSRLELREKRNRVIAAHTEIRGVLESADLLSSWGVETVLIGSYARDTAIYPGKDVDVFTKLTTLDTSVNPRKVFEAVRDVLVARYGDQAQPQARSIKVTFPTDGEEDFHVDVVPAVKKGGRWAIPRRDTTRWEAPQVEERWVETDPERMTKLTSNMNATLKVDGQGAYVPLVKVVRQTRWHHRGKEKPGGFYFELMTYSAFATGTDGGSFAEIFAKTLRAVVVQLDGDEPLVDPTFGKVYRPPPKPQDRAAAAAVFSDLATKAERALTLDRCAAAAIWRSILGENDRGPVFPLPPGCDERGNEIKDIAAVAAIGSREASGFA
jgi:hypothetical protein